MTDQEMKAWIDQASYQQLLFKCLSEDVDSPWFSEETGNYFMSKMDERRKQAVRQQDNACAQ